MAKGKELTLIVRAKDFATSTLNKIGGTLRGIGSVGRGLGSVFRTAFSILSSVIQAPFSLLKKLFDTVFNLKSLMAGLFAGAAVRSFANFEAGINQVATLVDTATVNMSKMADEVQSLGIETGQSFDSLNKALFDSISAGVDAGKATEFLGTAAKLAAGGATTIDAATRGLIAILNAYNLEADKAADVSDTLFAAMKKGVTTIEAMSTNLGKVSGLAKAAGIEYDELAAAIATITKTTALSTEEASTALRAFIVDVLNPAQESLAAAQALGVKMGSTAIPESGGLLEYLNQLQRATLGNKDALTALFNDVRSSTGALGLMGGDMKVFADIMDATNKRAGETEVAFGKVENQLQRTIDRGLRRAEVAMQELGRAAAPLVRDLAGGFASLSDALIRNSGRIQFFVQELRTSIGLIYEAFSARTGERGLLPVISETFGAIISAGVQFAVDLFAGMAPVFAQGARMLGTILVDTMLQAFGSGIRQKLYDLEIAKIMGEDLGAIGNAVRDSFAGMLESLVGFGQGGKEALNSLVEGSLKPMEDHLGRVNAAIALMGNGNTVPRSASELGSGMQGIAALGSGPGAMREFGGMSRGYMEALQASAEQRIADIRQKIAQLSSTYQSAVYDEQVQEFTSRASAAGVKAGEAFKRMMQTVLTAGLGEEGGSSLFARLESQWSSLWSRMAEVPMKNLGPQSPAAQEIQRVSSDWLEPLGRAFESVNAQVRQAGGDAAAYRAILGRVGRQIEAELSLLDKEEQALKATGEARRAMAVDAQVEAGLQTFRQQLQSTKLSAEQIEQALKPLAEKMRVVFALQLPRDVKQSRKEMDEFAKTMDGVGRQALGSFSQGVADAMVDLSLSLKTAEEAWASFSNVLLQMLKQLVAALIQFALLQALVTGGTAPGLGAVSGATSNLASGAFRGTGAIFSANGNVLRGGFQAFANGGIVTGPTLGLVGEGQHNEAIVPLPDGRAIPVRMQGGGRGDVTVTVNVHAVDARSVQQLLFDNQSVLKGIVVSAMNSDGRFARQVGERARKGVR